ncbi:CoA-binding protein [Candidatus Chloroploca sp. Khr17]|uniref:CoA-binding protein n=1 Tax=Candidatus Chloroploca sp. Khr17 TaxID=2496869 RepID=UPI00101E012C|nr:CoA-binding protein [Candidatus Chloroploca sp. Khr17]
MENWQANLLHTSDAIRQLLSQLRRVAVLGIRPERMAHKPAHYVPAALVEMGLEIVPVPVLDQDVPTILGRQVYPTLAAIPGPLDLVDVFRRSQDLPAHLDDMLAARPQAVWFQSGIYNHEVAEQLARAGIQVVQSRCLMVDYRHFLHTP